MNHNNANVSDILNVLLPRDIYFVIVKSRHEEKIVGAGEIIQNQIIIAKLVSMKVLQCNY